MLQFKFTDGDFIFQGDGSLERISGPALLSQNITKVMRTDKENILNQGSIPFRYNPGYGNDLNYVRQLLPIFTTEDARQAVQQEVRNSVLYYAKIQNTMIKYGLAADETIADATVLASAALVNNGTQNRVVINYDLGITTASGETTQLSGAVNAPNG